MTYVELIVVLGIFTVMLSIALFNYKKFEGKVEVKNLANDIALKILEAQKSSVSGNLKNINWASDKKPSYGVYFNTLAPTKFIYFADLNNSTVCDNSGASCAPAYGVSGEVLNVINITRGNYISDLKVYGTGCTSPITVSSIGIVFKRPSSTPYITTVSTGCNVDYVAITISSPASTQAYTSQIKVYSSGRIQIN